MTTKIEESPAVQMLREQRERYVGSVAYQQKLIAESEAAIERYRTEADYCDRCVVSIDAALVSLGAGE